MNPYDELGVQVDATPEQIKKAHRKLAMEHHPDRNGDEEVFKRIQDAYEILSDPDRRAKYDATGETGTVNIDTEAGQFLANMFDQIIEQNLGSSDMMINIINRLNEGKRNAAAAKHDASTKVNRLEKNRDRITTTEEHNVFQGLIDQKLLQLNGMITQINHDIQVMERVHTMIENYQDTGPTVTDNERVQFHWHVGNMNL